MVQVVDSSFFESPLFRTYAFYSAILVLKMMIMSPLTGLTRFRYKAFANPEDGAFAYMNVKPRADDRVERTRRAHLNDLENISIFYVMSFIYILTNPAVAWATLLFRIFTATRIIHTIIYTVYVVPQPARGLAWGTGFAITGAHLNDLENISLFFVTGFIYILTNPAVASATLLFRIFTAARIIHTIVYAIYVLPQPARFLSFIAAFVVNGYMAYVSLKHFVL